MSPRALLGVFVAIGIGLIVFIVVENSSKSTACADGQKCEGDKAVAVAPAAKAPCDKHTPECLPKITFVDTNGDAYSPEALAGKVVVINFWATWCHPCQQEIPAFSRVYSQFKGKGDVVMLGLMTDNPDANTLLNFESDHELMYPVVRVDRSINEAFGAPEAIPTTFIYDRGGHLRGNDNTDFIATHRGPMSEDQLTQILYQLTAEK
jgi:thiol-disulfide isomerase/thioredoxin